MCVKHVQGQKQLMPTPNGNVGCAIHSLHCKNLPPRPPSRHLTPRQPVGGGGGGGGGRERMRRGAIVHARCPAGIQKPPLLAPACGVRPGVIRGNPGLS